MLLEIVRRFRSSFLSFSLNLYLCNIYLIPAHSFTHTQHTHSRDALKVINTHYVSYNSLVNVINEKRRRDKLLLSFMGYALFMFAVGYVSIDFHNPFLSHEYASGLKQSLYETEFPSKTSEKLMTTFRDIDNTDDYWEWFDKILQPIILADPDYDVFDSHRLLWGVHFRVKRIPEGSECGVPAIVTDTINVSRCYYSGEFSDCLLLGTTAPYVSQFEHTDLEGSSVRSKLNSVYDGGGYVQNLELGNNTHTVYRPSGITHNNETFTACTTSKDNITGVTTSELKTNYLEPYVHLSHSLSLSHTHETQSTTDTLLRKYPFQHTQYLVQ